MFLLLSFSRTARRSFILSLFLFAMFFCSSCAFPHPPPPVKKGSTERRSHKEGQGSTKRQSTKNVRDPRSEEPIRNVRGPQLKKP